ncbi:MAG TPA: peptidoglycan editing factor PgeF [Lachnospiraceae bacterium]|nr:peptidoglycan editing factor PgeF [Lachnospiraceae bacterium]
MDFIRKEKPECCKLLTIQNNGIMYLQFPAFNEIPDISHLFTTRMGGVSEGIFSNMNLSYTRGDEKEAVDENYRRVAAVLGCSKEDMVCSDQTHTTNIRKVTEEDKGKGVTRTKDYKDVDGLVTACPGIALATFYADCVPLYFVDPVKKVIGLAHAGWRGTVGRIGSKMIEYMQKEYECACKDILVAIGPSICKDCYEISEDVAQKFREELGEQVLFKGKNPGKYQLDLWKSNEIVLLSAGLDPSQISITDICTCCNDKLLFSHRASHGKRGNLGAFLMLKKTGGVNDYAEYTDLR